MRNLILTLLLIPAILAAADSLYVLRYVPDSTAMSRRVHTVLLPGWDIRLAQGNGSNSVDIYCRPLVWNPDSARYDTLPAGWRRSGVDTTRIKLVYTTADTLPAGGIEGLILSAEGEFIRP